LDNKVFDIIDVRYKHEVRSPTCFGAYCAIFRENFIVWSTLFSYEHRIKLSLKLAQ